MTITSRALIAGAAALAVVMIPSTGLRAEGEEAGAAKSVESGMERAGSATKSGLDTAGKATGEALEKAMKATGDGVGYAIDKTGEGFKKAGDAMTGSSGTQPESDAD